MLLGDLKTNLTTQQYLMDAPPVVKTVNVDGRSGPDGYRTLLAMGMREGGRAYIGLDVTDPFAPKFLWQFTRPELGKTYGQPSIVQARFRRPGYPGPTRSKTAVVILVGGVGHLRRGAACDGGTPGGGAQRSPTAVQIRCPADASRHDWSQDWATHARTFAAGAEVARSTSSSGGGLL